MHRFVANHPHNVQSLLNEWIEAFAYKTSNISIYALTRFPKVLAQLLDAKSKQCCCATRR